MIINNKQDNDDNKEEYLPSHIGIIMDGNGRWAKKRGKPRKFGHKKGAKTFKEITKYAKECGIKYITFYAFSTENWKRPADEVEGIMNLFENYLNDVKQHLKDNIRVIFIGDKARLGEKFETKMIDLEEKSKDFDSMTLILAINYGGRDEIINGVQNIAKEVKDGLILPEQIDEKMIESYLYTKEIPDVDLIIRPSGEMRLSNFLIWQSAYAEFYFSNVLWPDFSKKILIRLLKAMQKDAEDLEEFSFENQNNISVSSNTFRCCNFNIT